MKQKIIDELQDKLSKYEKAKSDLEAAGSDLAKAKSDLAKANLKIDSLQTKPGMLPADA
jgi:outer membrane murein-binding lipoprotein Lpp